MKRISQKAKDLSILIENISKWYGIDYTQLLSIYYEVKKHGKLTTQSAIRLVSFGIPIFGKLAELLPENIMTVQGMVRNGKINFRIFERAMESINRDIINSDAYQQHEKIKVIGDEIEMILKELKNEQL
jgi:hypothetical protein